MVHPKGPVELTENGMERGLVAVSKYLQWKNDKGCLAFSRKCSLPDLQFDKIQPQPKPRAKRQRETESSFSLTLVVEEETRTKNARNTNTEH